MERQQLPLKYRPRTWDDLVGQKHAVDVLRRSIIANRLHNSYVLTGSAGSGKTSGARILAMALNCENLDNGNPCLTCISCTEALKGRNVDVIEIDGASHGQVEHIRDLKERANWSVQHRKRVFIIDEVHALSVSAFQSLLKLLEEPPTHVMFVLATTNPEKIPDTILSRSIKLDFFRHTEHDVISRMMYIAEKESIDIDEGSCLLIARFTDGGLRDSITILDQLAISHEGEPIRPQLVATSLGIVSGTELHSIMAAVLAHSADDLEKATTKVLERTTEFATLTRAINDWYRDVLRTKAGATFAIKRSESDQELLTQYANALTYELIDRAIQITWELSERVKFSSSNPKTFFLTGLYRLMLLTEVPVSVSYEDTPLQDSSLRASVQTQNGSNAFVASAQTVSDVTDLEAELRKLV